MILGPVFRGELLRTARRTRYYVLRFVYASILLLLVWSTYQQRFSGSSTATIATVAGFAESNVSRVRDRAVDRDPPADSAAVRRGDHG